jgi:mono/diheme cytochrome c family protein
VKILGNRCDAAKTAKGTKMTLPPILPTLFTLLLVTTVPVAASADGAKIYQDFCAVCHGDQGDGRSRARGSMQPPPRDFTSPDSAIALTRERMISSVANGVPRTAMAAWGNQLVAEDIGAVVDYIRNTLMRPIASETAEEARRLYAENCSVCHGDDGKGAKWTLRNMNPPPRNFTLPETAGVLDREYMLQTVRYGKANTAMPGFERQLDLEEIGKIVDFVRTAFMRIDTPSSTPAAIASVLTATESTYPDGLNGNVDVGMAFYLQNCSVCHGVKGDGKGPRAYFILPKPRDFQHPASRHGLDRARLFTAIAKGTRGTEMPAWNKVLTDQEIVNVAEYVYQAFIRPDAQSTSISTQ